MIAQVTGRVITTGDGFVVIEVGGIGYQVSVPSPVLRALTAGQERVTLHTHLAVREDALSLYGFLHTGELAMFRLLIGVNRVGPQLALNILSVLSVEDLAAAVLREDEMVLTRCPGIGPKNAKRLILELKDRMKSIGALSGGASGGTRPAEDDAVSALVALGFDQRDARTAVEAAATGSGEPGTEALIRAALARLKGW
jgi:Holliday junction DNA helicase RuvA